MRSVSIFGFAVLLGSSAVSAQNPSVSQMQLSLDRPALTAETCPLGMQVRQGIGGHLLEAKDGRQAKAFAARLLLTLTSSASRQTQSGQKFLSTSNTDQIKEAVVTVHGWGSGKGRVLRLRSGVAQSERDANLEVTKTLNVRLASTQEKEAWGEILVSGLTSWTLVDLDSVTYVNGETWTFSGSDSCHAVPDPILLISSH